MEDYNFDVEQIDFSELRNQKRTLIAVMNEIEAAFKEGRTTGDKEGAVKDLTGILNLIDSLQDHAVEVMGMNGIDIYDFVDEEERETETPEQIFARENAQTIFEMRIEGEGLYMDDEMSKEFILSIVDDAQHASAIKNVIRLNILEEVQDFPNDFERDADGKLTYDYTMYDYGYAIETYCRARFHEGKTETRIVYLCGSCGSDCVECQAIVNPNIPTEYMELINTGEPESNYCFDCQQKVSLIKSEIETSKKIIGYQVVNKNNGDHYENENDIWSLSFAREIQDMNCDTHKLLTIWTGDVKNPKFHFEGNPSK